MPPAPKAQLLSQRFGVAAAGTSAPQSCAGLVAGPEFAQRLREAEEMDGRRKRQAAKRQAAKVAVEKKSALSFGEGGEEEEAGGEGPPNKVARVDADAVAERAALEAQWDAAQERLRMRAVRVAYSMYPEQPRAAFETVVQSGATVAEFLDAVRVKHGLARPADALMYVRDGVILPHETTFHDLAVAGVGPFEERTRRQTCVCTRTWYEQHRRSKPACRWRDLKAAAVRGPD
eukprot:TRINITY_DN17007_c0_g1_i1.p2 TRINITY_DN17007_c0_g1~~TRINITY_DN17007_c0_g1_i1.p2  ORF type:complete len:248 (+),score=57.81 TRINITY_DN17007_c0_g1_i1:50-745(+)